MKKLPLSVSISAALHVAAVAWVGAHELTDRSAPEPTLTPIEIVAKVPEVAPVPVDVQFLSEPTTAQIKPLPLEPTREPAKPTRTSRVVASSAANGVELATTPGRGANTPESPVGKTGHTTFFDMRTGERADLTMPVGQFDDLDHAPRGSAPVQGVAPSGQLDSAPGGRKKSDQDVFVAKVDRDGTVKITDKRNLSAELSWNPAKLLSGRFDVTDWAMRSTNNDPYASKKLKFLDETRDERAEIGMKHRERQLQQTTIIMRKNLERAWAAFPNDMAQRKQALFDLWDEIEDNDGSDEILAEAARAARKAVVGFIRAKLPAGSEHAYTPSELVAFNQKKKSNIAFAPYE